MISLKTALIPEKFDVMMKAMKEYDNYIFDLYGTLVDIHTDEIRPSFWKKVCDIYGSYGAVYTYRELKDAYLSKVEEFERDLRRSEKDAEIDLHAVFSFLYEQKGVKADKEMIKQTAVSFREASICHIRLYAGATELLKMLHEHHKKVFLLSNAQELFTVKELEDLMIKDLFDDIFISSACGVKKPGKKFFKALMDKWDLDKDSCLMIGNDLFSDAKGAMNAGIDSYYIHCGLSPKKPCSFKATYEQDHMDLKLLKRRILNSF